MQGFESKKKSKLITDMKKQDYNEQTRHNKSKHRKNISYTYTIRIQTQNAALILNKQFTIINNNPTPYHQEIIKQSPKQCNNTTPKNISER